MRHYDYTGNGTRPVFREDRELFRLDRAIVNSCRNPERLDRLNTQWQDTRRVLVRRVARYYGLATGRR